MRLDLRKSWNRGHIELYQSSSERMAVCSSRSQGCADSEAGLLHHDYTTEGRFYISLVGILG